MGDAGVQEGYTLQAGARRILEGLAQDERLAMPSELRSLVGRVHFSGDEEQPFFPAPFRAAETHAAILGYIGIWALGIASDRYGSDDQSCEIDVEHALLNGLGALFARHENDWLAGNAKLTAAVQRWEHGQTRELYRQLATNIYKTKDGRWFSLHGSMDPTPTLRMLQLPQHNENLTRTEAIKVYIDAVRGSSSNDLDTWSNHVYRMRGTVCYNKKEFDTLPHVSRISFEATE